MTQNNEEVQTDLLLMTNNSAQGIPSEEPQSMSNTIENTGVSEEFPLSRQYSYKCSNKRV